MEQPPLADFSDLPPDVQTKLGSSASPTITTSQSSSVPMADFSDLSTEAQAKLSAGSTPISTDVESLGGNVVKNALALAVHHPVEALESLAYGTYVGSKIPRALNAIKSLGEGGINLIGKTAPYIGKAIGTGQNLLEDAAGAAEKGAEMAIPMFLTPEQLQQFRGPGQTGGKT